MLSKLDNTTISTLLGKQFQSFELKTIEIPMFGLIHRLIAAIVTETSITKEETSNSITTCLP